MKKERRDPRATFNSEMTPSARQETSFEPRREIGRVEIRNGYCHVHLDEVASPLVPGRLDALDAVAREGISIDFLKLSPHGLSFLAPSDRAADLHRILPAAQIAQDRCVVSLCAVNIRDEEGLLSAIMREAISLGVGIDHLGDGHDRLMLVVSDADADRLADHFRTAFRRVNETSQVVTQFTTTKDARLPKRS